MYATQQSSPGALICRRPLGIRDAGIRWAAGCRHPLGIRLPASVGHPSAGIRWASVCRRPLGIRLPASAGHPSAGVRWASVCLQDSGQSGRHALDALDRTSQQQDSSSTTRKLAHHTLPTLDPLDAGIDDDQAILRLVPTAI